MQQTAEKTVVIFRRWKQHGPQHIIALFPYEIADNQGHCQSYEHVGQHGGADYSGVVAQTDPALEHEYADLKAELEARGYVLEVRKRANRKTK